MVSPIKLSAGEIALPVCGSASATRTAMTFEEQRYDTPAGSHALRHLIADSPTHGAPSIQASNVLITPGARSALFVAIRSALDQRRHVVVFTPSWPTYDPLIEMAGGKVVCVDTDVGVDNWLTDHVLRRACRKEVAAIVINSPRNPDSAVVDPASIRRALAWSERHEVTVVFDQVYRGVPGTGVRSPSVVELVSQLPEHCIVVDGLSKSYGLAGLRLGWMIASGRRQLRLRELSAQLFAGASTLVQRAAVAVLSGQDDRSGVGKAIGKNIHEGVRALRAVPGVTCRVPSGGMFLFPRVGTERLDSEALLRRLQTRYGVIVADGAAFRAPGHIRLSVALPSTSLRTALARLAAGLRAST